MSFRVLLFGCPSYSDVSSLSEMGAKTASRELDPVVMIQRMTRSMCFSAVFVTGGGELNQDVTLADGKDG